MGRRTRVEIHFGWDERSGRYRDLRSGRYIGAKQARAAFDHALNGSAERVRSMTRELVEGHRTLASWEAAVRAEIRDAHLAMASASVGGWKRMGSFEFGHVGAKLREQYRYLSAFARGIADGSVRLSLGLMARAALYIQAARGTHAALEQSKMALRGRFEYRSMLGVAEHCDGCLAEAAKEWRPLGTLLPIGARDCRANCRCWFEYR